MKPFAQPTAVSSADSGAGAVDQTVVAFSHTQPAPARAAFTVRRAPPNSSQPQELSAGHLVAYPQELHQVLEDSSASMPEFFIGWCTEALYVGEPKEVWHEALFGEADQVCAAVQVPTEANR